MSSHQNHALFCKKESSDWKNPDPKSLKRQVVLRPVETPSQEKKTTWYSQQTPATSACHVGCSCPITIGDVTALRHETRNDPMELAALEGQVPAWQPWPKSPLRNSSGELCDWLCVVFQCLNVFFGGVSGRIGSLLPACWSIFSSVFGVDFPPTANKCSASAVATVVVLRVAWMLDCFISCSVLTWGKNMPSPYWSWWR